MAHTRHRHVLLNGVSRTHSVSAIVRLIPHSAMETAYKDGKLRVIGKRLMNLVNQCKHD